MVDRTVHADHPPGHATDEELTNDYATSAGVADFTMTCLCRSNLCRGTITGGDWRRLDLQRRYADHWVPGLLQRIRTDS